MKLEDRVNRAALKSFLWVERIAPFIILPAAISGMVKTTIMLAFVQVVATMGRVVKVAMKKSEIKAEIRKTMAETRARRY